MKLTLKREYFDTYTAGKLYVDGLYFCDTLEDISRPVKIKHETCIPEGVYKVVVSYSPRFKCKLPLLLNVPNFIGIRIHAGNITANTSGCILVGKIKNNRLFSSKSTLTNLLTVLRRSKDEIVIDII